jgi:predicted MPP superfamily phosphohydrolase
VIIGAIVGGDLLWWWLADRAAQSLPRSRTWRIANAIFSSLMLGYVMLFILLPVAARRAGPWMPVWVIAAMYLWHLLILPAALIALGSLSLWRRISARRAAVAAVGRHTDIEAAISRRQLLSAAAITAPPILAIAVPGRAVGQLQSLRVRQIDVKVPDLPVQLDGLTIAHVSDIHVGRFTRANTLPNIVQTTNNLRADLVLFSGDLIDFSMSDLPIGIDFMKKLDPRHGLMMVEGNHDLFQDPDGFERHVINAGLPLLLDDTRTLLVRGYPVQFMGIRWGRADDRPRRHSSNAVIRESVQRITQLRDPSAFPILLAHHPHAFDAAADAGIPLTIAGHTHGGQLMLTERFGAGSLMFKYWSGLYQRGRSSLVVSNGTGNWFPLRINAPAEIVHITLRATA